MLPKGDRLIRTKICSIGLVTYVVGVCRNSSVLLGLSVGCTSHMTGILARTEALLLSTLCTGQLHSGVHNCKLAFQHAFTVLFFLHCLVLPSMANMCCVSFSAKMCSPVLEMHESSTRKCVCRPKCLKYLMQCRDDAAKAIDKLDGYGYDNLILRVEWAQPRAER